MNHKRIFDDFISDKEWLIEQNGWYKVRQQVREAHFALGNGIIGSRGILEDLPYDANAGTFIAGIYDRFGAQIPELVNLPNPMVFRMDVDGEKIDPAAMDVVRHYRALDMKKGVLVRHNVYETTAKKRIDYQSYRFISMYQKFIGAMVVSVTPLDAAMTFNVNSAIDTSVCNRGVLTEGRKRHFDVTAISDRRGMNYTEVKTFEHQHIIGYGTCLEIIKDGRRSVEPERMFKIRAKKGETLTFIKYFVIVPSFYAGKKNIKTATLTELSRGRKLGVKRLLGASESAWNQRWKVADITMEGSVHRQKAVRFNIYHLMISANADDRVSIGARTLSGEGYRGHIFWDAETFIFPSFVFTFPRIARSMLMYRWQRLNHARTIAAVKGFKGALFPWESADSGEETTPSWFKDLAGEVLKIETLEEEQHINADIAYAINQYVVATGDEKFMINYGLEVLIETARFWCSRFKFNKKSDGYEIYRIMGPDEFHKGTNNNAFTNEMARFNIEAAYNWLLWARKTDPSKFKKLAEKIDITDREVSRWKLVIDKVYIPHSRQKRIIEEFDGYLKLPDVRITQLDRYFMPIVPHEAQPPEDGRTQLIKQADVVMLMYLLSEKFSESEVRSNYDYYEKRTLHKSSLSPSIHAAVGARLGELDKALHYLTIAINSDLQDIHGNAREGFHAASGGGAWQAMIMGFGGMEFRSDRIIFNPVLPPMWKSFVFNVVWRGALLKVKVLKREVIVRRSSKGRNGRLLVEIAGKIISIPTGKEARCYYNNKALASYDKIEACKAGLI